VNVPAVTVDLELNQIEAGEFVVGSSLVGGTDVIGDGLSEVQSSVVRCTIRRGRWGQLFDDFEAASVSVTFNNEDRRFDPVYADGDFFGELVPGRDIEISAGGVRVFTGFVQDYDLEYDVSGRSVTVARATDALGRLGAVEFDAWTNLERYAPSKLTAICERSEVQWPGTLRDFIPADYIILRTVTGPITMAQDAVSWGSNVLNYMKLIARSEWLSWLFASADGVLTLRPVVQFASLDNDWTPGAAVAAFGGAGIRFQTISAQYGSERLYAEVSVDTPFIDAQTATVADPELWQQTYGPIRRLSISELLLTGFTSPPPLALLVSTEDFVMNLSDDLLAFYEAPAFRITEFSVELAALSPANQATVLGIDIAQVVDIEFTPNGVGDPISQTLVVQGVGHDITPDSHVVTFSVIDYTT